MTKGLRTAARFLMLVAVVLSAVYLMVPASSTGSPYASSLSVMVATPAYATNCSNTICNVLRNPPDCSARMPGWKCKTTGQGCTQSSC